MLDKKTLMSIIEALRPGAFFRLRYMSDMPVKAEYKKQGIKVIKLVSITTRTGVHYNAIKGVTPVFYDNVEIKNSNWSWILYNKVKYNGNTEKFYLAIAPTKNNKAKTQYLLNTKDGSKLVDKEEIQNYIIDSYWRKEPNRPVNYIALDNILAIH